MDNTTKKILKEVADLHETPIGAYNIRKDGKLDSRNTTKNIDIVTKTDKAGIDIFVKEGTKNESLHIPVIITESGLHDLVYNDFHIGDNCDVLIIAGCGIHTFYVGKNSRVKYVEKHYGDGNETSERIMNPTTVINLGEGSTLEMETTQIKGIDSTNRITTAIVESGASLIIKEKIMTHGRQVATTDFTVDLNGADSKANVMSRSVAKEGSRQVFASHINGNNACYSHTECDAIIMDNASVSAIPEVTANHIDASLIHEAAIGKIAGEQLIKLMTLGLTEAEAEEQIVNGFLK